MQVSKVKQTILVILLCFPSFLKANPIPSGSALTLVAPATITQSGNYQFGNDITGDIVIAANDVEIDLRNYILNAGANGISITDQENIVIKNGVITDATSNGILIDTCTNVCIENITFMQSATAVSVLTTSVVKIQDCSFNVLTSGALNLETVNSGIIRNTMFTSNTGDSVIEGTDCTCMIFENLEICENIRDSGTLCVMFLTRFIDLIVDNCHINENGTNSGTFLGFNLRDSSNVVVKNTTVNTNNSTATCGAFEMLGSTNAVLKSCQANGNIGNSSSFGFRVMGLGSGDFSFISCQANFNTCNTGLFTGFSLTDQTASNVLKHCVANNNFSDNANIAGFSITSTNNCFIKCLAKENSSTNGDSRGFLITGISAQNLFQDCIAKSNSAGGVENGFSNTGIDNTFIRNIAQDHGVAGATNFAGVPAVATINPDTGAYTVPGTGDHPNTDNISVILP